jgi:hypothetical protein
MRVDVSVSDPWDLGESIQWRPLHGEIRSWSDHGEPGSAVLIELDEPVWYRGISYGHLAGSARLEGHDMRDLEAGRSVFAALTAIRVDDLERGDDMDMRSWRGGLGIIGTVSVEGANESGGNQEE